VFEGRILIEKMLKIDWEVWVTLYDCVEH